MYNYKMFLAYDGTKYLGWQVQTTQPLKTIQGKLENVLSQLFDEPVQVIASGRTDAGVHARMQVANFHTTTSKSCDEILAYLRDYLPQDIAVIQLKEASERFHARYNCLTKRYAYYIDTNFSANPFFTRYSYHIPETLDIAKMEAAAHHLLGTHDFKSFTSMKNKKKSTIKHIHSITIESAPCGLVIYYHGNGFLQHMVRILTGTLLEVGLGH
ncbi:MAG: tRNA pseudouridine(38-40) synthase TruA, partial [Niameybacter sp.]